MTDNTVAYMHVGFWHRFFAFIVDIIINSIIFSMAAILYSLVGSGFIEFFPEQLQNNSALLIVGTVFAVLVYIFLIVFLIAYIPATYWQATIGKKLLGIYIINDDGSKPSFWKLLGRNFIGYILSTITINIGFFMIGVTAEKKGLHDYIFKTRVVLQPVARF